MNRTDINGIEFAVGQRVVYPTRKGTGPITQVTGTIEKVFNSQYSSLCSLTIRVDRRNQNNQIIGSRIAHIDSVEKVVVIPTAEDFAAERSLDTVVGSEG
jgi:hypothetical protein